MTLYLRASIFLYTILCSLDQLDDSEQAAKQMIRLRMIESLVYMQCSVKIPLVLQKSIAKTMPKDIIIWLIFNSS